MFLKIGQIYDNNYASEADIPSWLQIHNRLGLQRLDRRRQHLLRRQAVRAAAIDSFGRDAVGHLPQEAMNALAECVFEIVEAAEERISIDRLFHFAGGVERQLAPHVIKHEASTGARHFTALHRMTALNVVTAGQRADHAVAEAEVELRC